MNAVKISAPKQRKSASRLSAMEFFCCTDSLPVQLNTVLAILFVRWAARAGWDAPACALLEIRVALSWPRVRERWAVGELVTSVRLESYRADPTALAIATVPERCTEAQQFFANCYVMLQKVTAAKEMLRTGQAT